MCTERVKLPLKQHITLYSADNISSYEDWIILKLAWLENEHVILMAENCRLFKQLYLQSKHVSDLESDIENLRKRMLGN